MASPATARAGARVWGRSSSTATSFPPARRDEALEQVNEATYRVWRLYMAACALQFEAGTTGVYQILGARRGGGKNPVPLTRRDLYPQSEPWLAEYAAGPAHARR